MWEGGVRTLDGYVQQRDHRRRAITRPAPTRSYNLALAYQFTPKADIVVGARNLTDRNYQLVDGFPEEGRNFYASLRLEDVAICR
ncbi:MAG: TonB-dependent receptor [Alphaproteobacteria bacterium]